MHRAIDAATRESGLELDGLRGAVVVLDVTTGAIVSIESRPTFSPTELQDGGLWATAEGSDRRAG